MMRVYITASPRKSFMIRPRYLDYEDYQVARSLAEYTECAERLLRLS